MIKADVLGEQSDFAGIVQDRVFSLTHERKPPAGELDPNLVGPAGVELNLHFAHASGRSQHPIAEAGILNSFCGFRRHEGHFSGLVPAQKIFQRVAAFLRDSMDHSVISLLELPFPHLAGQLRCRRRIPRQHHQAADHPVQPVYRAEVRPGISQLTAQQFRQAAGLIGGKHPGRFHTNQDILILIADFCHAHHSFFAYFIRYSTEVQAFGGFAMKIVILDGAALNPGDLSWEGLAQFGEYTVYPRTDSAQETIARIGSSEIVLTNKTPITREILESCPSVRYIGVLATGYNVIDCQAAREKGIPVTNVPSYGTNAVAQFTMALLLEICHKTGLHDAAVHEGQWERSPVFSFWLTPQSELAGKTMGIIGLGRIGTAVAKLAQAFGMRVIAYSRTKKEGIDCVDLDALLAESDVISLHCPQFPETERLIRRETLNKMKVGAILLNTSRGGLLDEADVAEALRSGKLRAAAVDVVSQEPILGSNPLLHAPNCIITPHMAWAPTESRLRLMDCAVENLRGFLSGAPLNIVN